MPRKHRRDLRFHRPPPADPGGGRRSDPPLWSLLPGHDVRHVASDKPYVCPGCDHTVRPGAWHLVVVPADDADARRHWHTECWRRELRRIGASRAGTEE
jgi:hypothetical protein